MTAFRVVRTNVRDDPTFANSFRSHYELGREPRNVERSSAVLHLGISTFLEEETAAATARKWDKLGDYVARLVLEPGNGFNFAHTGHPLHLTVWGDPIKLANTTADIKPI